MGVRGLRLLHLRGLRQRPVRTLIAVVAGGAGVALAVGVLIAYASLQRSLGSFTTAISGNATLRVEGTVEPGGLDAATLPRVEAAPGVRAAVPVVLAIVESVDGAGAVTFVPAIGVTCAIEAVIGDIGCTSEALGDLGGPIVGPALVDRLGPEGMLHTDLGRRPIANAPVVDALAKVNGGVVAVYDLALAQEELGRPETLDVILVVPEDGTEPTALRRAVEAAAGEHNRVLDASSNMSGSLVASLVLPVLALFSLIGLAIGVQLVRNTLELTLEERRRELATASALGASPRSVLRGILAESIAIGAGSGALGLCLGIAIAHSVVQSMASQVERTAAGVHVTVAVTPMATVAAVAIGVGVCVTAAIHPARRAVRRDLAGELSERARYRPPDAPARRLAIVVSLGGIGIGLVVAALAHRDGSIGTWQQPALLAAIVVTSLLVFRVPGQLVAPLLRVASRLRPLTTGPGRVAVDDLLANPRRTSSIAAAVGAPVILAAALGSIVPAIATGAERMTNRTTGGQVYVSTVGTNNTASVESKLPPDLEAQIVAVPGVDAVHRSFFASVEHPEHGPLELDAFDGRVPRFRVYRGADGQDVIDAGQAMIGTGLARARGLSVGDEITIPGRDGGVTMTIGGVWGSVNGVGRSVSISGEQMRRITGPRPPERIQLTPEPGLSAAALAERIRAAALDDRLIVLDDEELAEHSYREFSTLAAPFRAMQRGVLVVALVATASTLLLSSIQRRRELGILAALGMAPADLARTTLTGTMLVALAAGMIAIVASQAMVVCFSWGSEIATALLIPYEPRVGAFPVAIATATLVALIGAALPAWKVTRTDPITALREA